MFSTVRGKNVDQPQSQRRTLEYQLKKKGKKFFNRGQITFAHQLRPIFSSVNQRKKVGIHPIMGWKSSTTPLEDNLVYLLKICMPTSLATLL